MLSIMPLHYQDMYNLFLYLIAKSTSDILILSCQKLSSEVMVLYWSEASKRGCFLTVYCLWRILFVGDGWIGLETSPMNCCLAHGLI